MPTQTDTPSTTAKANIPEWRIVPTIPSPDPDCTARYTASPGPSDGFTKQRAQELARGRNRAGEPSPSVTWHAEPTGTLKREHELQTVNERSDE